MKVLIIEDEKLAAQRLAKMLEESTEKIDIIATLHTVEASVDYLKNNPEPDLIFLDIQLGDGKSFDIFKKVQVGSRIIFTTAFDEYALKAFKYNSVDYLLKPLKKKDLESALAKYLSQTPQPSDTTADMLKVLQSIRHEGRSYKNRFLVKKGSRLFSVGADEVSFIYTKDRINHLKTQAGDDYIIDENLEELEAGLDPEKFYRANRQFIVNYAAVKQVVVWFDGKLKLVTHPVPHEEVIISRLKAGEFKKWLGK
ncbi:DNA-binding response regulator [Chitinophaga lutea]|uniref:DNA-binding response regulator n=1 Tax=Chitinophaga lutea TaxID=2488634 RepID=A0A3N4PXE0_9BACT|nr:LytTR family DNA-binding domain-containing protein [Chitinophaga lutea]RPE12145.1 DNA-binding response regulator [Chitinophaga lutea]